jgi:hypothetical protein
MNDNLQTSRGAVILGALLALGLIIGGWILGAQIKATRLADRYVTVKGLVERTVKSDLAIWPLSYKEAGDELTSVYARTEADKKTILDFLSQQDIQPSEIELGVVRVVDTQANEYGGPNRALIATSSNSKSLCALRGLTRSPPPLRKPCSCCKKASCSTAIPVRA